MVKPHLGKGVEENNVKKCIPLLRSIQVGRIAVPSLLRLVHIGVCIVVKSASPSRRSSHWPSGCGLLLGLGGVGEAGRAFPEGRAE